MLMVRALFLRSVLLAWTFTLITCRRTQESVAKVPHHPDLNAEASDATLRHLNSEQGSRTVAGNLRKDGKRHGSTKSRAKSRGAPKPHGAADDAVSHTAAAPAAIQEPRKVSLKKSLKRKVSSKERSSAKSSHSSGGHSSEGQETRSFVSSLAKFNNMIEAKLGHSASVKEKNQTLQKELKKDYTALREALAANTLKKDALKASYATVGVGHKEVGKLSAENSKKWADLGPQPDRSRTEALSAVDKEIAAKRKELMAEKAKTDKMKAQILKENEKLKASFEKKKARTATKERKLAEKLAKFEEDLKDVREKKKQLWETMIQMQDERLAKLKLEIKTGYAQLASVEKLETADQKKKRYAQLAEMKATMLAEFEAIRELKKEMNKSLKQ